ncbi:AAA family ATPase [Acidomonas methanolica]|uniref:DNA repair ATPase n=1 Tax=Acidomonas methanolica NBRC 104435 TaxID=1231351 RepID=A0A023D8C1_ACIMT|nr:AAA family ATPase [Acidomonas methanolica]MBU2653489.1 AAA family ATPase [Acidomonas methanolica]TCS25776.1 DNA repair exonuclease SbcCD ATPase subunit [Acidomonas methanolica]GAJ30056.1 DNA repair ATPase [Acidomonas methanolica NBRC 104435]GBQ47874.1 SMC domain-containing protein [Acidomonas methanolica]GEK99386.1 GTP-binding protein [Acidomonas methanolica NBRC 104435]
MRLHSLDLVNFRKFRKPLSVSGFTGGLNIVVEPNETGKSTLLEALRAAFFIRHSAKTELVRSYCPFGDDVAPKVSVSFEIAAQRWQVEKQFLKSPYIRLTGPNGRVEGDPAEDQLQTLLGFEKGNNRGSDPETRGALGLLWVEQATALSVEAPNRLVRDNIRSALEAEVGTVLGGRRFELVRTQVEEAYASFRTPRSGKSTGRLAEAEASLVRARERREATEATFRIYEQALSSLEEARTAKRLVDRDLADPEQAQRLQKLRSDLKIAETAQLRLSTASARYAEADAAVRSGEQQLAAFDSATQAVEHSSAALAKANTALGQQHEASAVAASVVTAKRTALNDIRERRATAETAVEQARSALNRRARATAMERARVQLAEAQRLEGAIVEKEKVARTQIDKKALTALAALDRKATETRVLFEAGAVAIDIELMSDTSLRIDDKPVAAGRHEIVRPTEIRLDQVAKLIVTPPSAGGLSAEANLRSAADALADMLKGLNVESYSVAVTRSEQARAALQDIAALKRQIEALCPGDASIGLQPGAVALKELLANNPPEATSAADENEADLPSLEASLLAVREEESAAIAVLDTAQTMLHDAEKLLVQLQTERTGAERDAMLANQHLDALQSEKGREAIDTTLAATREELARRLETLEQVKQAAGSLDVDRIRKGIANMEREQVRGQEERLELVARIASLEAVIANDGPKGLAGLAAEARDLEQAASAHLTRLQHEADTLELLRNTLRDVGDEASRTFLGPITRRAARYVERVLPGSDLAFDEEMGLSAITRGGIDEACGDLSRGTQEQLAVLTRLAFADLLLDKGAPVSLILDDPLVYSDDGRFEAMTDILTEAAQRMQVILLTCRAKAFRHVAAHRITITEALG